MSVREWYSRDEAAPPSRRVRASTARRGPWSSRSDCGPPASPTHVRPVRATGSADRSAGCHRPSRAGSRTAWNGSAAGNGRQDHDDVAVGQLAVESSAEAYVFVVDIDVDEPAQLTVVDESLLDAAVVALDVVDQLGQSGAVTRHDLVAVGVGAQTRGDTNLAGHGLSLQCSCRFQRVVVRGHSPYAETTVTSSSVT